MSHEQKKNPPTPEKKLPQQPEKDVNDESYDKTIEDSFPAVIRRLQFPIQRTTKTPRN